MRPMKEWVGARDRQAERGGDGDLVDDERVVASLTRLSPSRMVTMRRGRPSRLRDGGGGDGVGRRDDGAENKTTDRERKMIRVLGVRDEPVREIGDDDGGGNDEADGEQ